MEPVFGFMKAILGFTRMSVRGLNKVKRELGFVLMALNIRKVVAQRAENNQKFIKRQFLYYFNRNCLFSLIQELYVPDSFIYIKLVFLIAHSIRITSYILQKYFNLINGLYFSFVNFYCILNKTGYINFWLKIKILLKIII